MQEFKAPKAERLYNEANRKKEDTCYALVTIYNGNAVINDVMINDISISKLAK